MDLTAKLYLQITPQHHTLSQPPERAGRIRCKKPGVIYTFPFCLKTRLGIFEGCENAEEHDRAALFSWFLEYSKTTKPSLQQKTKAVWHKQCKQR
ncbi:MULTISPECIES: hypothetical protein [unclassified Neisseria]|uniref:hypothetical protein n=1 Tax=unclassified Neisseria TaxID=2623750 RepID=UPI0010717331|nr:MULTISPECIES: hypothetical protein [unclassified Neisseria]MBF0804151.1 hypothetical protein [Neisseria sp. 19428wB4_WF04]TFU43108.1 hypothetical protein E4T99_07270 [Neisseria sp. WF04]